MMLTVGKCRKFLHSMGLTAAVLAGLAWCPPARAGLFDDTSTPAQTPPPPATHTPPPSQRPAPQLAEAQSRPASPPRPQSVAPVQSTALNAPAARLPVSSEARQRAAAGQVREVFGEQMDKAATPDQCRQLSATLLETAKHTDEPDGRFALLVEAENCAVLAGDVSAALAAQDAMRSVFDLSTWPAAGELFRRLARSASSADDRQKLCAAIVVAANDAIGDDQFAEARQLDEQALSETLRLDDRDLSDRAASMMARINACEAERKRIAPAIAALAAKPAEPAANAAVGKYLCFFKRDWARGLPMLAKGSDAGLKSLAESELKTLTSSNDQLTLADGWWEWSDSQPPLIRSDVRLHAGKWYAQASSGLSGLSKLKAEERAEDYLKSAPKATAMAEKSPPKAAVEGIDGSVGMLRALPPNLFPPNIGLWDDTYRIPVNDALRKTVVGQIGTFTIAVDEITRTGPSILTTTNKITPLGQFTAHVRTSFDPEHAADWDQLHEDGTYVVTGRIHIARFTNTELYCFVTDCRIASSIPGAAPGSRRWIPAVPPREGGNAAVSTLQDLAAAVPIDLMPKTPDEWRDREASRPFAEAFQKAFRGKIILCRFTIARTFPLANSTTLLSSARIAVGSNYFSVQTYLPTSDPRIAGVQIGTACAISGQISGFNWGPGGMGISIHNPTLFEQQR